MVTGTVSGLITIQKRDEPIKTSTKKPVSYKYVGDTSTKDSNLVDQVVTPARKDKLSKFEFALRRFQYAKALDCVMIAPIAFKTPAIVVTLFDELIRYTNEIP